MKPIRAAEELSREELDPIDYQAGVVAAIEQGLADAQAGRVVDDADLDDALAARLGDLVG